MRYLIIDEHPSKVNRMEFLEKNANYDRLLNSRNSLPSDASSIIVNGIKRGCQDRIIEANNKGIPWIHTDNGYFGKDIRFSINSTTPIKIVRKEARFKLDSFSPYRGGSGKYVLILPPGEDYAKFFNISSFLDQLIPILNRKTDLDIVVRPQPLGNKFYPGNRTSLIEHLEHAYVVIAWGSAVCITAVQMGIPTISLGWCPMLPISFSFDKVFTSAVAVEPKRSEAISNQTWFSINYDEYEGNRKSIFECLLKSLDKQSKDKFLLEPI